MTSFKTTDFNVVTCDCYYFNWRKIKRTADELWKFEEIENGKESIRKLFYQKMTIFHCCKSCFDKSLIMNPFTISENSCVGHCIMFKTRGIRLENDICNACIWFFIENFKKEFKFLDASFR